MVRAQPCRGKRYTAWLPPSSKHRGKGHSFTFRFSFLLTSNYCVWLVITVLLDTSRKLALCWWRREEGREGERDRYRHPIEWLFCLTHQQSVSEQIWSMFKVCSLLRWPLTQEVHSACMPWEGWEDAVCSSNKDVMTWSKRRLSTAC